MNTCDTCKHYRPGAPEPGDVEKKPPHLGWCARWRGGDGTGGYGWSPEDIAENEVVVETDEGWGAQMGPKFGCVLHEHR